ncbi:hypothetical protein [Brevinema andersonii]|nr:hypothetical protein [Brevinema andersonii]
MILLNNEFKVIMKRMNDNILVIGAGIAGLLAAQLFTQKIILLL